MTDRCISGSWLGDAHHCVHPAVPNLLGDPMFCAACEASIAGLGPLCDCPGCSLPYPETETTTMTDTPTSTSDEPTVRRPRIEIYPYDVAEGADPEWGFRLRAENRQIVTHGEGYKDPDDAEAMARKIIIDHAYDNAVVVFLHPDGESLAESPHVDPPVPG